MSLQPEPPIFYTGDTLTMGGDGTASLGPSHGPQEPFVLNSSGSDPVYGCRTSGTLVDGSVDTHEATTALEHQGEESIACHPSIL